MWVMHGSCFDVQCTVVARRFGPTNETRRRFRLVTLARSATVIKL